jgi:hypothetical protein
MRLPQPQFESSALAGILKKQQAVIGVFLHRPHELSIFLLSFFTVKTENELTFSTKLAQSGELGVMLTVLQITVTTNERI